MASGQVFNRVTQVHDTPDAAIQKLAVGVAGAIGYSITSDDPGRLVLARAYGRVWPLVVTAIGIVLFFLALALGLVGDMTIALALLLVGTVCAVVKKTERLAVSASPDGAVTVIAFSGRATPDLVKRISIALRSPQPGRSSPMDTSYEERPAPGGPDCPQCSGTVWTTACFCQRCGRLQADGGARRLHGVAPGDADRPSARSSIARGALAGVEP
jgi:hypothetical protein